MSAGRSGNAPRPGVTLEEVRRLVGGELEGDPGLRVRDVVPIARADAGELGFLAHASYLGHVKETRAGALLVERGLVGDLPEARPPLVIVDDPGLALARLLDALHADEHVAPGVHPTAVLGRGVRLGEDVSIGPYAVVEEGAVLGDRVRIGAHVVVGRRAEIGDDSLLHPHVVLYADAILGRRVILHAGARIGVDGFGYVHTEGVHRKVKQVGGCTIGDDVEIGANSCVDRGSIGHTEVGANTKIDNLVHLGHNVVVGKSALLVAQVGVSGSCRIEDGATLGGQAGVAGHLEIGRGARVAGQAGVIGDVPAGETVMGFPARPQREFLRAMATLFRLPDLVGRVRALERRFAALGGPGLPRAAAEEGEADEAAGGAGGGAAGAEDTGGNAAGDAGGKNAGGREGSR